MGLVVIFVLAISLLLVPPLVDRWALARGASPETLVALAAVTLVGVAALPLTFVICTGFLAFGDHGDGGPSLLAITGLLLVAVTAGRTVARMLRIRGRWATLARLARALDLPRQPGGVRVLPLGELLAFVSGSDAFISQGLIERLTPAQRQAVIEHEREHAEQGHARLLAAARSVAHGTFELGPARHAAQILDRELDALADQAAVNRLGDAQPVHEALRIVAAANGAPAIDSAARARIERLCARDPRGRSLVNAVVRIVALSLGLLVLAAICLSVHAGRAWLGIAACLVFIGGFASLAGPALRRQRAFKNEEELRNA